MPDHGERPDRPEERMAERPSAFLNLEHQGGERRG